MSEESTAYAATTQPDLPAPLGSNHLKWGAVGLGIVIIGGMLLATHGRKEVAADATPAFTVTGDSVDIRDGAAAWSYLDFAQAQLGPPIALEPVPARVAFDETRSQPIVAPLQGRVEAVSIRLGQRVEKGDRLLAIRSPALVDLSKEIDLLRSKETARSKVVERLRALVALKAVPEKDLVSAEQDLRQAQLARQAAELKLSSLSVAEVGEGRYWLTAPQAGVVVERNVLMGQEAGPDRSDPLLVIAEVDEVIVTADVPESEVRGLQVGQPASVSSPAAPDRPITGHVEYVGEVVDPLRRMVNVRVRVANPDRSLRPNAFVQVAFSTDGPQRVLVPAEAVVTDDQRSFVFVRVSNRPERLERRPVSLGRHREGHVEIVDGLSPGEAFVSKGALLLLNAVDLAQS
jgi:cobalt-zinc-cadmium efflux system membrane fusion protein